MINSITQLSNVIWQDVNTINTTKSSNPLMEYSEYLSEQIDRSISYTEYLSSAIFSKKYDRMKKIKRLFN